MADTKITALAAITTVAPANDLLPIVDVDDHSMAASGTTKNITVNQILGAGGTATLASATITGDLTVDTSTLKVDSANNRVGVGTASPTKPLEVYNTTESTVWANTTTGIALLRAGGTGGDFYFGIDNSTGGGFGQGNYSRLIYSTGAYPIIFSSNASERYRIASDGVATWSNVGGVAGTAMTLNSTGLGVGKSPAQKLDVNGTIQTSGYVFFTTPSASIGAGTSNSSWLEINSATNFNIRVNGGDRFLVDTSGNVGIGVTPSAWGATAKAIQIGSYSGIYNDVDFTVVVNNAFFNGTNNIYRNTAPASQYYQQAGSHVWRTAPSGTAGQTTTVTSGNSYTITAAGGTNYTTFGAANNNVGTTFTATSSGTGNGGGVTQNITFTQSMTLDASGNLGIGGSASVTGIDTGVARLFVVAPNSNTGMAATFIADSVGRGLLVADQGKTNSFGVEVVAGLVKTGGFTSGTSVALFANAVERARLKSTGQLRFVPLAADPAGAEAGDVYYNSSSNKLKCYNGSTWNDLF